jgi:hypothetical protein
MNYFTRLLDADNTASTMRLLCILIVVEALVILAYKVFSTGDISDRLGSLIEKMIGFALAGKAGQSAAEQFGSKP